MTSICEGKLKYPRERKTSRCRWPPCCSILLFVKDEGLNVTKAQNILETNYCFSDNRYFRCLLFASYLLKVFKKSHLSALMDFGFAFLVLEDVLCVRLVRLSDRCRSWYPFLLIPCRTLSCEELWVIGFLKGYCSFLFTIIYTLSHLSQVWPG